MEEEKEKFDNLSEKEQLYNSFLNLSVQYNFKKPNTLIDK